MRDDEKLGLLYELYEQQLYWVAYSVLHQEQQAEDAVQDTFEKLVKKMNGIQDPASAEVKYLLLRMVKNTAIDKYRKNNREKQVISRISNQKSFFTSNISSIVENHELLERILTKLNPESREVVQYHYFLGLTYGEISGILGVSEDAIAKRCERARKQIRTMKEVEEYGK